MIFAHPRQNAVKFATNHFNMINTTQSNSCQLMQCTYYLRNKRVKAYIQKKCSAVLMVSAFTAKILAENEKIGGVRTLRTLAF